MRFLLLNKSLCLIAITGMFNLVLNKMSKIIYFFKRVKITW